MRRKKDGFTLIELLVVIAVIAMLLSVVMPALNQAKERARRLVCKSNLKQAMIAMLSYSIENNEATVPSWQRYFYGAELGYESRDARHWYVTIRDYIGDSFDLVNCPSARTPDVGHLTGAGGNLPGKAQFLWWKNLEHTQQEDIEEPLGAYGYNCWLDYTTTKGLQKNLILKTTDTGTLPADVPVVGDSTWGDAGWVLESDKVPPDEGEDREDPHYSTRGRGFVRRYSMNRHGDGINMAFLDGHVEHVEVDELMTLHWHKNWRGPVSE